MQTVIRPLALAVAALSLAGSALAASSSPSAKPQSTAQPTSASAVKPAKSKSQTPTTLVATGKIVQFDAAGQALTLSTSKGEQHFTVGPSAHLQDSSHAITLDDLGKLAGHKATVRYKESAGEKSVESIRVSSSAAKTSTKG
jgi:predicted outer membrane protein